MIALPREATTPLYVPDFIAKSIEKIDFKLLQSRGIKFIAFDADSTLVPYRGIQLSASNKRFLRQQKKLFKAWIIASNRVTNDLHLIAEDLEADVVRAGIRMRKPKRRFFNKVLERLGAEPHEVAMIGDKLIADMWGAKRAGMVTVWVEHLGKDSLLDRIIRLRSWERRLLRRYL